MDGERRFLDAGGEEGRSLPAIKLGKVWQLSPASQLQLR